MQPTGDEQVSRATQARLVPEREPTPSRSLVLCSEEPPPPPTPHKANRAAKPKRTSRPSSGTGDASRTEKHSSHLYLFHSSNVPAGGERAFGTPPPTSPSPSQSRPQRRVDRGWGGPKPPFPAQATHYSLGRLSRSQPMPTPTLAVAAARDEGRERGEGTAPPGLESAWAAQREPATHGRTGSSPHRHATRSLYEHVTTAPELLTALQRRRGGRAPATRGTQPVYAAAGLGAASPNTAGGMHEHHQQHPQRQSTPPHPHTQPPPPPLGSHALSLPTGGIPFSTDSPNRSALPSQEASLAQLPAAAAGLTEVEAPDSFGDGESLPPLPPRPSVDLPEAPPASLAPRQAPPDSEPCSGVAAPAEALREGRGEEDGVVHAADAIGLEPVLASSPPKGRYVVVNLLSSWGDEYEVGLCGVELFDERGVRVLPPPAAGEACQPFSSVARSVPSASTAAASPPPQRRGSGQAGEHTASAAAEVGKTSALMASPSCAQTLSVEGGVVSLACYATPASFGAAAPPAPSAAAAGGVYIVAEYAATGEDLLALADADRTEALRTNPRRQLSSLLNGKHNTHDEEDMFTMGFTAGQHHLICFMFPHPITLSMVRLVNYCGQGRVHTSKGARVVEMTMDDVCIFRGEIRQHSGGWLSDPSQAGLEDCENILFTTDRRVLERILRPECGEDGDNTVAANGLDDCDGGAAAADEEEEAAAGGEARHAAALADPSAATGGTTFVIRGSNWDDTDDLASTVPASARVLSRGPGGDGEGAATLAAAAALPQRPASTSGIATGSADPSSRLRLLHRSQQPSPTPLPPGRRTRAGGSGGGGPARAPSADLPATAMPWRTGSRAAWAGHAPPHSAADEAAGARAAVRLVPKPRRPVQYPTHCPQHIVGACILLLSTWGDVGQVGLSGLRLRDAKGHAIRQTVSQWAVLYPDGSHSSLVEQAGLARQAERLFDECASTACALPFHPAMLLVMLFDEPIPSLGFLEVANYSIGRSTFSGAKEVRLFLSDAPDAPEAAVFTHLWTAGISATSRRALRKARVFEVSPSEGVSLRKAPAYVAAPRFQTYDLSLQTPGPLETAAPGADDDAAGSRPEGASDPHLAAARYAIGAGPGTGAATPDALSSPSLDRGRWGGGGGMQYIAGTASFANSLNASMNIRAVTAMRRARMSLRERPAWLLDYQPYLTPLLPVGYVLKVRLAVSARSVGQVPLGNHSESTGRDSTATPTPAAPPTSSLPPASAAVGGLSRDVVLKAYLMDWVAAPFASCRFVNEAGQVIHPIRPGTEVPQHSLAHTEAGSSSSRDEEEDEDSSPAFIPMVAESVLTTNPTPAPSFVVAASGCAPQADYLNVVLEMVYVADTPFCLAVLNLCRPLVLDGSAAWVRNVQVRVDDSLVFDSGDAVLALKKPRGHTKPKRVPPSPSHRPSRSRATAGVLAAASPCESPACAALTAGRGLAPCETSLRPHILFTIDNDILAELKEMVDASRR